MASENSKIKLITSCQELIDVAENNKRDFSQNLNENLAKLTLNFNFEDLAGDDKLAKLLVNLDEN